MAAAALATAIASGAILLATVRAVAAGTALMIRTAKEADAAQISPGGFATAVAGAMLAAIAIRTAFAARFAASVAGAVTRPLRVAGTTVAIGSTVPVAMRLARTVIAAAGFTCELGIALGLVAVRTRWHRAERKFRDVLLTAMGGPLVAVTRALRMSGSFAASGAIGASRVLAASGVLTASGTLGVGRTTGAVAVVRGLLGPLRPPAC